MKLEHLFDGTMWYEGEGAWVYTDHEAIGYGEGGGELTGARLRGSIRWSNHPVRRPDGVWLADIRGFIETADGGRVLMTFRGRGIPERAPDSARDVVGYVTFRTSDAQYRWLDAVMGVLEARFHPQSARMPFRVFACINELPAIRYNEREVTDGEDRSNGTGIQESGHEGIARGGAQDARDVGEHQHRHAEARGVK